MRSELQQELNIFKETVLRFIDNEIAPYYEQWEKDKIIPFYMGKEIYNLANKPKSKYFTENDDHMMEFNQNLVNKIELFLKSLN